LRHHEKGIKQFLRQTVAGQRPFAGQKKGDDFAAGRPFICGFTCEKRDLPI
jgi:hypothetical protein